MGKKFINSDANFRYSINTQLIFLVVFSIGIIGCSKTEVEEPIVSSGYPNKGYPEPPSYYAIYDSTKTIQWNIDNDVAFSTILDNHPIDSLYGKDYGSSLITAIDTIDNWAYVASKRDFSKNCIWSSDPSLVTGANSSNMAAIDTNTTLISYYGGGTSTNPSVSYYFNGHVERLPPADLLLAMKINLHLNGLGNFKDSTYWAGTECPNGQAYALNFDPLASNTPFCVYQGVPNYFIVRTARRIGIH